MKKLINRTVTAAAVGSLVFAVADFLKFHREQEKIRALIRRDAALEVQSIALATGTVLEKIRRGDYRDQPFSRVEEDFEFYTIASRPVREEK